MTRKITTFAIFAALMVLGGFIFYSISNIIPIPGSKFIVMGPYLTFVMIMPLIRYPRFGTLSLVNIVFGGLMLIISPWMTLAIVVSGVLADIIILIPIKQTVKHIIAMGIYNGASLLTSFYVTNYITGNALYQILHINVLVIALVIAFLSGALGGYAGIYVDKKYLKIRKTVDVAYYN